MLTVWHALIGALYSLVLMFIFEIPRFVGGLICLTTVGLHVLFSSASFLLVCASLAYISVEENGILNATGIVILFVAQSTFLSTFRPPKGNAMEYIGACLIIVACILEPLATLIKKRYRKDKRDEIELEANEKTRLCK